MSAREAPLNLDVADQEDEIKLEPIGCNPLRLLPLIAYFLWVQVICFAVYVLMLLGINVRTGSVTRLFVAVLGTKFRTTPNSSEVLDDTKQPVFFFCNHRCFADFFTDNALLGGPSVVSRWLVAIAIPFTALWGYTQGWIWFISRGTKHEGGTVNFMIDFYTRSHQDWKGKGLVVYPEGTRTRKPYGDPLKHGGIVVAHSVGWPVQCIITTRKENMVLESKGHIGFGNTCVTSISPPIRPEDFAKADDFIAEVERVWKATWKDAYTQEGTPRNGVLLPGVRNEVGATVCPGARSMWIMRVLILVAVAGWFVATYES